MKAAPATQAELQRALYAKVGKRYTDLETQLVYSVIDYLGVLGFPVFRRNVGALKWLDRNGKSRLTRFNEPGQSDVWAIGPSGLHIEIEVKKQGEVPRANQAAWLSDVARAGGIALCVTSLDELAKALKREFEKRELRWLSSWDL